MSWRRGSILVVVLFVLIVLSLSVLSLAYRAALLRRAVHDRGLDLQVETQAQSALAVAVSQLPDNNEPYVCLAQPWHTSGALGQDLWLPEWAPASSGGEPEFTVHTVTIDEEGKLPVVQASSQALEKLGLSSTQIDSLLDWMDEDEEPRSEGAESESYLQRPIPYRVANRPLKVLDELLMIRGFSVADYYGSHRLESSDSLGAGDGTGPIPGAGWVDMLTCVGQGQININTAPGPVLATLPISPGAVDQILAFRGSDGTTWGPDEISDHVFQSAQDIEQLQGLAPADVDALVGRVGFRSEYFRIFVDVKHRLSRRTYQFEAVVHMQNNKPQVLSWKKL